MSETPPMPPLPPRPPLPPVVPTPPPGYAAPPFPGQPGMPPPVPFAPYPAPPPTRPAGPKTIGLVALIVTLLAAMAAGVVAAVACYQIGLGTMAPSVRGALDKGSLAALSPVRDWVLVGELSLYLGTALGLWGIVQGLVAIVRRRGRALGVAAVVVAAVGPVLFFIAVSAGLGLGAAAA